MQHHIYFSYVDKQIPIGGLPDKPAIFADFSQPEVHQDTSAQQIDAPPAVDQQQPASNPVVLLQQNISAAASGGVQGEQDPFSHAGGPQIVINYPDGRWEIIDFINAESVRRVAKAEQVIPGPAHSLACTVFPQQPQTGSSPPIAAQLQDVSGLTAAAPIQDLGLPEPTTEAGSDGPSTSGSGGKGDGKKSSKGKKKSTKKYHSHSSPSMLVSEQHQKTDDPQRLFSITALMWEGTNEYMWNIN